MHLSESRSSWKKIFSGRPRETEESFLFSQWWPYLLYDLLARAPLTTESMGTLKAETTQDIWLTKGPLLNNSIRFPAVCFTLTWVLGYRQIGLTFGYFQQKNITVAICHLFVEWNDIPCNFVRFDTATPTHQTKNNSTVWYKDTTRFGYWLTNTTTSKFDLNLAIFFTKFDQRNSFSRLHFDINLFL